jgi:hypothetical protein
MDEQPKRPSEKDETFGWTADDSTTSDQASTGNTAERMLAQLQSMIDSIATQAAPVVRQVGIKAARSPTRPPTPRPMPA